MFILISILMIQLCDFELLLSLLISGISLHLHIFQLPTLNVEKSYTSICCKSVAFHGMSEGKSLELWKHFRQE